MYALFSFIRIRETVGDTLSQHTVEIDPRCSGWRPKASPNEPLIGQHRPFKHRRDTPMKLCIKGSFVSVVCICCLYRYNMLRLLFDISYACWMKQSGQVGMCRPNGMREALGTCRYWHPKMGWHDNQVRWLLRILRCNF